MYRKTHNSFFSTGDFCRTPGGLDLFSHHPTSPAPPPDRGGFGFMDDTGGYTTDGFVSCTEGLGCESSVTGDGIDEGETESGYSNSSLIWERARRRSEERKRVLEIPPPLTSFDKNGRRDFILRPERKDGRLQLTEVEIRRPEIMYAIRENGRLTLRLVEEDEVEEEEEERIEEDRCDCWSPEAGEAAIRRCYEYEVAGQQHMNVWSPRFVTTM